MQDKKRVNISEETGVLRIIINHHNSVFHAFFLILILNAIAGFFFWMLSILNAVLSEFACGIVVSVTGTALFALYLCLMLFLIFRPLFWIAGGRERIDISRGVLYYKKSVFGAGKTIAVPLNAIIDIKIIDYVEPKDIIQMVKSEAALGARCFQVNADDTGFTFGIYLTHDEIDEVQAGLKAGGIAVN